MFIRSARLFLRPGWSEDWQELLSRINDWAVIGQLMAMAEHAKATILAAYADAPLRRYPEFVVTLPGGDGVHLIGGAGLLGGDHGAELVYWIAPEYCGQGYATEAGRAVLGLARTLGHRQITAVNRADNAASGRVLAKLGFQATGATSIRPCRSRGVLTAPLVHRRHLGEAGDGGGLAIRHAA